MLSYEHGDAMVEDTETLMVFDAISRAFQQGKTSLELYLDFVSFDTSRRLPAEITVALVTTFGDLLKNFLVYYRMKKDEDICYRFSEYTRYFIVNGILLFVFYIPGTFCHSLWSLLTLNFLFLVFYRLILLRYHPFNEQDTALLNTLISSNKILSAAWEYFFRLQNRVCGQAQ
ncbi:MAG: hypothetical protein JW774_11410 [Candidatus Aureabacteria bacterium]|nr:hypothetical protein [Candidatus Auribacterota bacterium]